MATDAEKFYGSAFTEERKETLSKAVKYLDMAVRAEANGETNKIDMALNAALKAESLVFGS
jgi:hypothetical protein